LDLSSGRGNLYDSLSVAAVIIVIIVLFWRINLSCWCSNGIVSLLPSHILEGRFCGMVIINKCYVKQEVFIGRTLDAARAI
jgi:hypothetical protein